MLERYGVELIGAKRRRHQEGRGPRAVQGGDAVGSASTCRAAASPTPWRRPSASQAELGLPLIIRPSLTLGGTGGGIATTDEEFESRGRLRARGVADQRGPGRGVDRGLEGIRARGDARRARTTSSSSARSRTSIPMGVHTGDSITVAPAQTLTDKEYQLMRDAAVRDHPRDRRRHRRLQHPVRRRSATPAGMVVIEMNPRVSRSSALASQGHRLPDRQDRRQAGRRLHARRDPATTSRARRRRASSRPSTTSSPRFRASPSRSSRRRRHARHADEVGGRGDGHRPHLQGVAAEGAALAGDRQLRLRAARPRRRARRRAASDRAATCPTPTACGTSARPLRARLDDRARCTT